MICWLCLNEAEAPCTCCIFECLLFYASRCAGNVHMVLQSMLFVCFVLLLFLLASLLSAWAIKFPLEASHLTIVQRNRLSSSPQWVVGNILHSRDIVEHLPNQALLQVKRMLAAWK